MPPSDSSLADVRVERHVLRLQLHAPDALGDRGAALRRGQLRDPVELDQRVARARDALVELHDDLAHGRPRRQQVVDRVDDLVEAVQVLGPERVRHADLAEEPPAAGLAAERRRGAGRRRTSGCRG